MLSKPRLITPTTKCNICWRCFASSNVLAISRSRFATAANTQDYYTNHRWSVIQRKNSRRAFTTKSPCLEVRVKTRIRTHVATPVSAELAAEYKQLKVGVYEQLKKWESENSSSIVSPAEIRSPSEPPPLQNQPSTNLRDIDKAELFHEQSSGLSPFSSADLLDVGIKRKFLRPGDLVEIPSERSQTPVLAIYVRDLGPESRKCQFFTIAGAWEHQLTNKAQFFVPNFVDAHELNDIIPYLPTSDVPEEIVKGAENSVHSIPRNISKPLLHKMLSFLALSNKTYQSAASSLDAAHVVVAKNHRYNYATLDAIAEAILPSTIMKEKDGRFPKYVLYAVHRSLFRDDIGFRAETRGMVRAGGNFEIYPSRARDTANTVKRWVREYHGMDGRSKEIQNFASKAQRLIDASRETRHITPFGMIGPYSKADASNDEHGCPSSVVFGGHDASIIKFLESWAGLDAVPHGSLFNGTGSAILRAIGRYTGDLTPAVAWTMLQEIGAIAPWENRAAHELRLPFSRSLRLLNKQVPSVHNESDSLSSIRKKWENLPVYCIDDPGAHEIDDGISIESTEMPGEHWIHVHTADPAAYLSPAGPEASRAQHGIETVYMPEQVSPMLDQDFVQRKLSLAPKRACLTFSARMNMEGDILEYKITPGEVSEVAYLSYQVLNDVVLETGAPDARSVLYRVGPEVPTPPPSRIMLKSDDLTSSQKSDLRLLHSIGKAREQKLKAKGGRSGGGSGLSVSVSVPPRVSALEPMSVHSQEDPTIELNAKTPDLLNDLARQQSNLVQNFMLVAGEIAARWCDERGIPVPFRVTPRKPDSMDPSEFYTQHVLPSMDENGTPDPNKLMAYFKLLEVQPSTIPGPHAAIGVEMMAKCTSPLRRFGDLLLHWQVEAALLREQQSGESLVGNTRDDFLPFTRAQLEAFLPKMDFKERLISYGKRRGERHWVCQFLIRAWLFGEAEIPAKMPFVVEQVDRINNHVFGTLTTFLSSAECVLEEDHKLGDLTEGDRLEVELDEVDAYALRIRVKALGRMV